MLPGFDGMSERRSINSYLDDFLKRGDETAFVHRRGLRRERWSYERVARTAFQFARELEARGVAKGERVLLWAENNPEWVAAFFGCSLRGAVVVPLDVESEPQLVARIESQVRARLLLVSANTHASARSNGDAGILKIPALRLEELSEAVASRDSSPYREVDARDDDLLEIIYTSGTTAEPRGVTIAHSNVLANLAPLEAEIKKYLRWERLVHPVRFLNLVPLSHVFGQFMGLFVPQLLGGEVHFHDSLNPSEITWTIRRERVSVLVAVPRLLETLRESVERHAASEGGEARFLESIEDAKGWNPLRRWWAFRKIHRRFGLKFWAFITGGATLPEETERFWGRLGFVVLQGYGMTETASLITVNHPFKKARRSVGQILPGHEVKLAHDGEILVRGKNVSPGYWVDESARPLTDEEGWLRTGDVGEMDSKGNIFFKGRKKETIVTAAGLNIHPEDLEAALERQTEVRACAVLGIEGPQGPEPLAALILKDDSTDPARVIERANQTLSRHQRIRRWLVWPEADFPRTPTQKIRKRDILEAIKRETTKGEQARRPSDARNETDARSPDAPRAERHALFAPQASSLVSSLVPSIAARIGGAKDAELSSSANLSTDLKLDSIGRVELLSALEDRYQIEIDEAAFTAATTLGDIERIVQTGASESDSSMKYPYPRWTQSVPFTWLRVALFYLMVLPITSVLCWVRVRGAENLRDLRGPVLFISNHITYFDHALILSALPGRFRRRFAIAQEGERLRWWRRAPEGAPLHRRLRWLAQYFLVALYFNTFSLPQKSGFRRSFAYAGETMDRGFSILVFPEGTRTPDGKLRPFMGGVGILATKLDAPVVPLRIHGLSELKLSGRRGYARPGSVTITFGEPVKFDAHEDPAKATRELERRVASLQP